MKLRLVLALAVLALGFGVAGSASAAGRAGPDEFVPDPPACVVDDDTGEELCFAV